MRALVVFESMFGNTRTIAEAIAEGVGQHFDVQLSEVGEAPSVVEGVDLVVAGGPTHAFGMTRPNTREDAARRGDGAIVSQHGGLREWLATLKLPRSVAVATFDTRIDHPRVPGSAAKGALKRLERLGGRMVTSGESFFVTDVAGPLVPGEPARAAAWGEQVAAALEGMTTRSVRR